MSGEWRVDSAPSGGEKPGEPQLEIPEREAQAQHAPAIDHPLRSALAAELHARPPLVLDAPQRGSDLAMLSGEGGFAEDFAHSTHLWRHFRLEPPAQSLAPDIARIEDGSSEIASNLAEIEGLEETRDVLARVSRLSVELEAITARTSFRFDATRACHELTQRRTRRLREERIEGIQTIEEFLERRLAPAMATCSAAAGRIDKLAQRLARASSLLRTRVEVDLEAQNRDLLSSMDRRAQLQARLQSTLEAISICALTHYLSALLAMCLRALNRAGSDIDAERVAGMAIPVMRGVVWGGLRWARRAVIRADAPKSKA